MLLKKFLSKSRIIDVKSDDFAGVLSELLNVVPNSLFKEAQKSDVLQGLLDREYAISTYLETGVCMPHMRVQGLSQKYLVIVGRCDHEIKIHENEAPKKVRMVFLLLSDDKVESYMDSLSMVAKLFSPESDIEEQLDAISDLSSFKDLLLELFNKNQISKSKKILDDSNLDNNGKPKRKKRSIAERDNELIIRSAVKIAKAENCSTILVQADAFKVFPDLSNLLQGCKVALVTESPTLKAPNYWDIINVRAFSQSRFSQLRSAIMIGITKGIFGVTDKLCCIGGIIDSDKIDGIVVVDIEKEFSTVFTGHKNPLPEGVRPEVIERVIDIATELSVEGREGKSVGCIFIIGNGDEIRPFIKQLILNPFYGYKAEDRNILNPFMDETVKEYSLIDGAIVVDGNGILESAGALIHTPDFKLQLPGGLGARHAAAYSISLVADCISIVVSSSSGQITLFRRGQMLPITEKRRD